jgi:L,D-peptidoglycan transpeptidase YkuD (ErfK/YbiS/YcfS/YnhG family)
LGYNDAPVLPGCGSAIFLHLARPGYLPTEGCVALAPEHMLAVMAQAGPGAAIEIRA